MLVRHVIATRITAAWMLALMGSSSPAATLSYDESASGDLGDYFAGVVVDLGTLTPGHHTVTGGLRCEPYPSETCDFSDAFSFVIAGGHELKAATLAYGSSSCEIALQCDWGIWPSQPPIGGYFIGNTIYTNQSLLGGGVGAAGVYDVAVSGSVEFGDNGQQVNSINYQLSFDVAEVPAPAGLPLFATAFLAALARRRR